RATAPRADIAAITRVHPIEYDSMGKPSTPRRRPKSPLEVCGTTIRPHGSLDCEPPSPEVLIRGFAARAVTCPTSWPCRHLVITFVDCCVPDPLVRNTVFQLR